MYAVPASNGDASTQVGVTRTPTPISGLVTSFHVTPWFRDTWTMPLMAPIQMTPGRTVDAAIDQMHAQRRMLVSLGAGWARVSLSAGPSSVRVTLPCLVGMRY